MCLLTKLRAAVREERITESERERKVGGIVRWRGRGGVGSSGSRASLHDGKEIGGK